VKTYHIHVDEDPYLNTWIASIRIGKHVCCVGDYTSPRAARKAAKDFIKQLKEAESSK
jgi:uncharacterized protein (UPF0147 family)